MLSTINGLKISWVFISTLATLFPYVPLAQHKGHDVIDLANIIKAKSLYNKKIIRRETCSLDGFIQHDSLIMLAPRKLASNKLDNFHHYELTTDTVIAISIETENLYKLIAEKFDELKYDDNYYLESLSSPDEKNRVAIFTDIYQSVRILFIKLKDKQYCIID